MAERLPEKIELEIVTPERQFFAGSVDEVTVPGINGYLGILPGHAPLLSELKNGVISIRSGGDRLSFFCGWGFVEVLPDRVSVLAEVAQDATQIDSELARSDKQKAESLFKSGAGSVEGPDPLELWESAVARLEVSERSKVGQ